MRIGLNTALFLLPLQLLIAAPTSFAQAKLQPMEFIYMRAGLKLPVVLRTPVSSSTAKLDDCVLAQLTADVPLDDGQMLRSGTKIGGNVVRLVLETATEKHTYGIHFDRLCLSNGTSIPIVATTSGGMLTFDPGSQAEFSIGQQFELELGAPAQVAAVGRYL